MKSVTQCLLLFLAINLSAAFTVPAQSSQSDDYVKLSTRYDRFTDQTTVETELMRLWGTTYDHLEVSFGAVYKGSRPSRPTIGAIFKQIFKDTKIIEAERIYVIADGQRFTIEGVERAVLKNAIPGTSVYRHEFSVFFDIDTAWKLAKANKIEMRIGHLEVSLQPSQRDAIRRLLARFDVGSAQQPSGEDFAQAELARGLEAAMRKDGCSDCSVTALNASGLFISTDPRVKSREIADAIGRNPTLIANLKKYGFKTLRIQQKAGHPGDQFDYPIDSQTPNPKTCFENGVKVPCP